MLYLIRMFLISSLICLFSITSLANEKIVLSEEIVRAPKALLRAKLAKNLQFSADFTQKVIDDEQKLLQESSGSLTVKKPNLVHWQTTQPEETLLISDGKSLWFYDPFIEQATAYSVNASIANTPVLLLTSTDESLWEKYSVTQRDHNSYLIHSNDKNSQVETLELTFSDNSSLLSSFTILDATGQLSIITLMNVDSSTHINESFFTFEVPEGVFLDDQR